MRRLLPTLAIIVLCVGAILMAGEPNKSSNTKDNRAADEPKPTLTTTKEDENSATASNEANNDPPHWYTPLKRPEWWLVVAAFLTIFIIGWQAVETRYAAQATRDSVGAIQQQAGIMERQAKASEDAAQASRKTAESIIKIERAWIDVYLKRVGPALYQMEVTNCGRTVAQIEDYSLVPKLSAPEEKINAPHNFEHSTTVYCSKLLEPRDEPWIAVKLNLVEDLGKEDFAAVWSNNRGLAYYGIMRYNDTAGEPHETQFCYCFNASQGSRYLERVQAAEYNKHT
jgi:hypothetical protein